MGSSDRSVRLLLSDYEEEATSLADEMEQENAERQKQEPVSYTHLDVYKRQEHTSAA